MVHTLKLQAPAKVNLALDIVGKRADGYHLLETVFQAISLYDTLTLTRADAQGIGLQCDQKGIPCDARNLAWKAADAFLTATGLPYGVQIRLEKHIPSQAGLGGGSADAAAVLYGCNVLMDAPLSLSQLCQIGAKLGADVPFFLYGGTAYAEGIGEKLEALPPLPALPMVVAKGSDGISTPAAYRAIDRLVQPQHPKTQQLRGKLKAGAPADATLWSCCGNLFEAVTDLPDVAAIRRQMIQMGAQFACMSGSGAAVFGIFPDEETAQRCQKALAERYPFAACCHTTGHISEER
jgi:4-diphosphocytidyl-2-C-methyl-D-erythritol kinase